LEARSIWVVAEQDELGLRDCTLEAIAEARVLADRLRVLLEVVLLGADVGPVIENTARQDVDVIHRVEHPLLARYTTDAYVHALEELLAEAAPILVLMSATAIGKDLAPRVAARLRWGLVTGCIWVMASPDGDLRLIRPSHQSMIHEVYSCPPQGRVVATLQPGAVGVEQPEHPRIPEIRRHNPELSADELRTKILDHTRGDPRTLPLGEAEIVVAGGRGVAGREGWQVIDSVADALGAVAGGTRIALDLGYIPPRLMIGLGGELIRPHLYIAAGISGAIHHLGGVRAENIVAVNIDRHAPLMRQSTLAIVGDLHAILPLLAERIRRHKAEKTACSMRGTA
jgi:electron transfer flavoprotein alpha subunit